MQNFETTLSDAAQVAYEVMLQEEYDNQLKNVLALSAAVKHYCNTMDFERRERAPVDPDEVSIFCL